MLNNFIDNNLKWVHKPEDFSISNDIVYKSEYAAAYMILFQFLKSFIFRLAPFSIKYSVTYLEFLYIEYNK